jgi:hypothetical protein
MEPGTATGGKYPATKLEQTKRNRMGLSVDTRWLHTITQRIVRGESRELISTSAAERHSAPWTVDSNPRSAVLLHPVALAVCLHLSCLLTSAVLERKLEE